MEEKTLISTWHIVRGEWVHIHQTLKEGYIYFYTDGKLILRRRVDELEGVYSDDETTS